MNANPQTLVDGIQVFGSAIVRAAPDIASIKVAVSRTAKKPSEAFAKAHTDSRAVHDYLMSIDIDDVRSSRVTLSRKHEYRSGLNKFVGYEAKLAYSILIRELDQVETLLVGVIDAGANELSSVSFQTTRLKEIREEARKRAMLAARQKAEVYAEAAGVTVGSVRAIEDVNPEVLSGRSESHVQLEPMIDDPGEIEAIDPGAITIGATVNVLFNLE